MEAVLCRVIGHDVPGTGARPRTGPPPVTPVTGGPAARPVPDAVRPTSHRIGPQAAPSRVDLSRVDMTER